MAVKEVANKTDGINKVVNNKIIGINNSQIHNNKVRNNSGILIINKCKNGIRKTNNGSNGNNKTNHPVVVVVKVIKIFIFYKLGLVEVF